MLEDYRNALRAGQRATRAAQARGQSPYLAVLDDILRGVNIVAQEPLGLVDIPAESIVGTKTAGRHTAFAPNFMPILEADSEFARKWSNLCDAHLEEGIRYPITAYEYLNKFYVEEGNKRVSVLKYYEAVKIPGTVTRLVPERNETLENKIYYEFLDFYKLSKINYVHFSRLGGYAKLQTLVCKATSESWTDDDRLNFASLYTMFSQQFYALGGSALGLTPGDALLVYLAVYRYSDAIESTPAQVRENLSKLWDEIKILTRPQAVELQLEPATKQGAEPLLSKLNIFSPRPSELRVVLLHEHNAQTSAWVRGQDKGRDALLKAFPGRVRVSCRENVNPEVDAEQVLEDVAHDNADIVFTTSARMHPACLKVAAQHPGTRFLNCSLNAPHPLVRTYYPRTYEVTYLLGMLAGITSRSDHVGYVAANPVYGVPAAINAFVQGLRSVRPEGRVVLRWACLPDPAHPLDFSDRKDIEVFYARDDREPEGTHRDYGLCRRLPDGILQPIGLVGHEERRGADQLQRRAEQRHHAAAAAGGKADRKGRCAGVPQRGVRPGPPQAGRCHRHLHSSGADEDGLAGRVRGGRDAPLRSAGCQEPVPAGSQRAGPLQGRAAVKNRRTEWSSAKRENTCNFRCPIQSVVGLLHPGEAGRRGHHPLLRGSAQEIFGVSDQLYRGPHFVCSRQPRWQL